MGALLPGKKINSKNTILYYTLINKQCVLHEAIIQLLYGEGVGRHYGIKQFNMAGRTGDKTTTNNTITAPAETYTMLSQNSVKLWLTPLNRIQAGSRIKERKEREGEREGERG